MYYRRLELGLSWRIEPYHTAWMMSINLVPGQARGSWLVLSGIRDVKLITRMGRGCSITVGFGLCLCYHLKLSWSKLSKLKT